jgi:2-polyprenyl-3-methyl-5-hydroxy-6-metoxy-1,4-benzoquinol methylase
MRYAKDVARAVRRYKSTVRSVKRYPEFQEYFVHYPLKESKYSSHYYFERLTGTNQRVLDIGCGEGFMAEKITAQGNRVVGIDVLSRPARESVFEDYVCADLSHGMGKAIEQLPEKSFDKILLMDVLEHLVRPEQLLQDCQKLLKSSGQLLVSVPNVANLTVRLSLTFGKFAYTDRGILDKTHLRFFTRKTIRLMLEANGFEVIKQKMTVVPLELILGLSAQNPLMKFMTSTLAFATALLPGLLGYQTVLVARTKPAPR